jgi:hypothetical protein
MECVFHMYMQQEHKAMVMTLYMTVVKQLTFTTKKNNLVITTI